MTASSRFDDDDVQAYADGQLVASRRDAFDAALGRDPTLAVRVGAIRAQSAALRDALDPVLAESIPERLLEAAAPRRKAHVSQLIRANMSVMAAAAALLIGIGVGWFGRTLELERQGTPVTFAREAAYTHALYASDVNRPVEVWANEEKRLVAWLTKRLGHPVHVPDLNPLGYALVGGRLVAGNEKPTALLMYENADRERLSLQVRWPGGHQTDTAFRYAVENGVGVFYWIDENCSYAISGTVDRTQLLAMARVVYG
ncbi:MAG: anti-sigma factor, partial [Pseudomonadota bacterium]|nr:anti-sigma factor [Pseudomonadota bacterium]